MLIVQLTYCAYQYNPKANNKCEYYKEYPLSAIFSLNGVTTVT